MYKLISWALDNYPTPDSPELVTFFGKIKIFLSLIIYVYVLETKHKEMFLEDLTYKIYSLVFDASMESNFNYLMKTNNTLSTDHLTSVIDMNIKESMLTIGELSKIDYCKESAKDAYDHIYGEVMIDVFSKIDALNNKHRASVQ